MFDIQSSTFDITPLSKPPFLTHNPRTPIIIAINKLCTVAAAPLAQRLRHRSRPFVVLGAPRFRGQALVVHSLPANP